MAEPCAFRLIALDIDGTLLTSQATISPRMKAAIAAAQEAGVLVSRLPHDALLQADGVSGTPLELAVIDALPPLERAAPLLTMAGCRTIISYSGTLDSYFMEVFKATCSKGEALRRLAGRCGVPMAETVAI